MKLQLTIFAQDLKVAENDSNIFAVAALLRNNKPTILGKTEQIKHTDSPDFTKIFVVDYELGQDVNVQVTLMDGSNGNRKIGTACYNVGTVLGTKGGVVGKALCGGFVMVHMEKASGLGTLQLQLQGVSLQTDQDVCDPYLELQTKRRMRTKKNGETKEVWDVVFRSMPIMETTHPTWAPIQLDYGILCHSNKQQAKTQPKKVRIRVLDYDDRDDTTIGTCLVTIPQLMENMDDKQIPLKRHKKVVGNLVVLQAKIVDGDDDEEAVPVSTSRSAAPNFSIEQEEEEDIDLSAPLVGTAGDDDIVLLPESDDNPTFSDYIAGGCQLKVVVAIDYTASNGDPRKEQSLHHFTKDGTKNEYQSSIHKICSILAQYDSDQKYSVYGFGAKKNGQLSHCFAVSDKEVEGVDGILNAYKDAFTTGIAMSKPTNICDVIEKAGQDAKASLEQAIKKRETQEYTILTIFTNGNVHDVSATVQALQSVKDDPISVVVVGVGPSDFADMGFLNDKDGLRVHFVDAKAYQGEELTSKTLSPIPTQLESYFGMKEIMPNPPIEPDEIVILPNSVNDNGSDGFADVTVGENGDIQLETGPGNALNPDDDDATSNNNNDITSNIPEPLQKYGEQGKKFFLAQAKRQFGRVSKQMTRNMNRMVDQKVNQMFGIKNATGGGGGRRRNGRR